MELNDETLRFIREHCKDDVRNLALQAPKYPGVDMPVALTQIAGRQAAHLTLLPGGIGRINRFQRDQSGFF